MKVGAGHETTGWLTQICDENSCMRDNSKFSPKVCACADFRRKFCANQSANLWKHEIIELPSNWSEIYRSIVQKSREESAHAQNFQFKIPVASLRCTGVCFGTIAWHVHGARSSNSS